MSIRSQAIADLRTIAEDADGFGWSVTVTDPDGESASVTGLTTDVSQIIDPQTGQAVTDRHASATFAIASLVAAGLGIPRGIADGASKPWLVVFNDGAGTAHTYKVQEALVDWALSCVVCRLEAYESE